MNPNDPNVALLERAAEQLGEALLEQLVFVGGAVAGVLITDPAMPEIRPTQDVDVICRLIARSDYHQLGRQLRQRGLQPDRRQSTVTPSELQKIVKICLCFCSGNSGLSNVIM